jgi:hypothetical protein
MTQPTQRGRASISGGIDVEHPVIGAWTAQLKATNRFGPDYATASFHPDGTMTITIAGYTAHGAWQATDAGTTRFRAVAPLGSAEGQTGWHTLVFDVRVAPDGGSLTLEGTYERPTPSGTASSTAIIGSGERLVVGGGAATQT